MNWILGAVGFIIVLCVVCVLTLWLTLRADSRTNHASKYILNKFEPDNTAPKLSDMIEFHKTNVNSGYKIN